jgi:hypothetical protein
LTSPAVSHNFRTCRNNSPSAGYDDIDLRLNQLRRVLGNQILV